MVQGGMKVIKNLLFLFNLCFFIFGAILLGLGVSTKVGWNERYLHFIKINEFSTPPNILIAVGAFIFVLAFLGCCGAYKENNCMIMTYSVLVGLILVIELGAAFAAFALKDDARQMLEDGLNRTQYEYGNNATEQGREITSSWNALQQSLSCCGTHNFTDWKGIVPQIPTSCCHTDHPDCLNGVNFNTNFTIAAETIYVDGCLQKAIDDFAVGTLGIVALVLAVLQLLGVICACFLGRSIRYSYETV